MDKITLANNLLAQKEQGFSLWRSIRKSWKRLFSRAAMLVLAIYLYFSATQNEAFLLAIGVLIGGTLQDIGWVWRIGKSWTFTEEIINWDKVKQIAKGR